MSMKCMAMTGVGEEQQDKEVYTNPDLGTGGSNYISRVPANTFKPGNDYTCTFTNARTRVQLGKKTVTPDINRNFTVNATASNGITSTVINAVGMTPSAYRPLTNVEAETVLSEGAVPGWRGVELRCVAQTAVNNETQDKVVFGPTAVGTIGADYTHRLPAGTFKDGNDYICTFTNEAARIRYE